MKSFTSLIIIFLICSLYIFGVEVKEPDQKFPPGILKLASEITLGALKDSKSYLPNLFSAADRIKQTAGGYPFAMMSQVIDTFCTSAVATKSIFPKVTPNIKEIQFQLRSPCHKFNVPLIEAKRLTTSPNFDPAKKVVIFASGWTTSVNTSSDISAFSEAFNCRSDVNFVAVDTGNKVDIPYTWAALHSMELGREIATGLADLVEIIPVEKIHLIGFSLGAHIMGAAGRNFHDSTGKMIPRITALDPAKPCFSEGETLSGIMRGDADFIDVIHTNPGVLGKREPIGDVDFYPGGDDPLPPGCFDIICAHSRSWNYFVESIYPENEHNFPSKRCTSLSRLRANKCKGDDAAVFMGYSVSHNLRGKYFLEVNNQKPFGKGSSANQRIMNKNCGLCAKKKNQS